MKKIEFIYKIIMVFLIGFFCSQPVLATEKMTFYIHGRCLSEVEYAIEEGELLVPARLAVEELGGRVQWYGALKILQVSFGKDVVFKMQIDQKIVQNPQNQVDKLKVPPRIIAGQTMIPIDYFAKYFGLIFRWDDQQNLAKLYKPANWVLDLDFIQELSGERLVITSTKKVPYETYILKTPNRLVIDIKQSVLSAQSSGLFQQSYLFKSVNLAQHDQETVRVVAELNNQVPYNIIEEESSEGFKLIVAFSPGIRNIMLTEKGLDIQASGEIGEYSVFELTNPQRLVIDISDQTLQLAKDNIELDHPLIKKIRASQLSWQPKVVRLVLDLNQKIRYNVLRGQTAQEIIIQTKEATTEATSDEVTIEKPNLVGETKTEFILVNVGEDFGDGELVSIGITKGINQRLIIRTSTPIYYNAWFLPNPDRLVVDLKEVTLRLKTGQLPTGQGIVKGVRMHQHSDKVRVVFDLNNYTSHHLLSPARSQIIEIGLGENPLAGKVIVLDPGHGGKDPGAIGYGGIYEKTITLDVGLRIKKMLKDSGATVIMSRDKDVFPTLGERVELANQLNADIFVSIHCNSFHRIDPGGTETYMPKIGRENCAELATAIHCNLVKNIQLYDRGVKAENFYVLRNTTMPAALVEIAFISKKEEAELVKDPNFLEKAALGIYEGIATYFSQLESGESND